MKEEGSPTTPQAPTHPAMVSVHPGPVVQNAGNAYVTNAPIMSPPPGAQPMIFMKAPGKPMSKNKSKCLMGMGITQVVTGGLAIVFNIVATALFLPITAFVGPGFLYGIPYIIAGAFGIAGGKTKKCGFLITFMVLSIISSVITTGIITTAAIQVGLGDGGYWGCQYDSYLDSYDCEQLGYVINGLLLLCGIVELVISIISSALCCSVVCCKGQNTYVACPVQYSTGGNGVTIGSSVQGQVTVVTQQNQNIA